jgi:ubiquinone biosynthesis protein
VSSSLFAPPRFSDLAAAAAGEKPLTWRQRRARFRQIWGLARRHGLLPFRKLDFSYDPATADLRARQARGLREALEEAGGGFIKAGQLLSTRDDILPAEWVRELSRLQKEVNPAPAAQIEELLERELGERRGRFATFDVEPLAAASILLDCDIDIMLRLAGWATRRIKQARQFGALDIAKQYAQDLRNQADFAREASNLESLAQSARSARDEVRIPRFFPDLSTDRVLTMEFIDGETITALRREGQTDEIEDALRTVLRSFLRQLVIDGVFHADLHPGNVIIDPDGTSTLIDFGSVGRLDRDLRQTVQDLAIAFLQGDTRRVADAALAIMPLANPADEPGFRRALAEFVTHDLGSGSRITLRTIDNASDLFTRYGSALPADLVAAGRAFAILEGTLRTAAPTMDVIGESRDAAQALILSQLRPRALAGAIGRSALGAFPRLRRLPDRIETIVGDLADGKLTVKIRLFADDRDRRVVTGVIRRVSTVILGGMLTVASFVMFVLPPFEGGSLSPVAAGVALAIGAAASFVTAAVDALLGRRP